ncbi:MAG TPA: hypothetical protein VN253_30175, partial [Kofleriaceae bacterium]|nr:hypothetical protein [Kofleriaceae bacterium]
RARELLEHLRAIGVIGWATPEAIARAAKETRITTSSTSDVVRLHWTAALYGHIGLPPGAPAAVTVVGTTAVVAVSAPGVEAEPGTKIALGAEQLRALLRALESRTGMVTLPELQRGLDQLGGKKAFTAIGGHDVFTIEVDRPALEAMFGAPQVAAWADARRSAESPADAARTTVAGTSGARDHGLGPDEALRVRAWLAKHLPGAAAGGDAFLDRTALRAIDRVEAHAHRDEVLGALARLRASGGAPAAATSWELDALLQQALIEAEAAALRIEPSSFKPLRPTFATPLPARIDQRAGRVVSGETVPFTIVVDFPPALLDAQQDHDFRYRSFTTDVTWIFEKLGGGSTGKPEHHHARFRGAANHLDHRFTLAAGEERAIWEVRAHVRHTHFLPAYLTTLVEVKSEPARMAELRDEAFRDLGPVQRRANDFHTSPYNEAFGDAKYDQGQRLEGALPKDFRARTAGERTAQRAEERARLEQLIDYLGKRADHGDAMRAARWHLDRLREADRAITGDEAGGLTSFEVRGTFLSRQPGVEDGPLDLYGSARRFERDRTLRSGGDRYDWHEVGVAVQLRDLSRRFESDVYRFEAEAGTFDHALEAAFVKLCKAYPPGRVAIVAQQLDPRAKAPTGKTTGFELDTGTAWKDTKAKVFDPIVKTVATLAGVAAMVFVPATAPVVAALLAGYGAVESLDEIAGARDKGTLTGTKVLLNLGSIALDVLPLVGRATVLGKTRAGLFVLEGLDRGAQVAYMTAAAHASIRALQEQHLLGIARTFEELLALEKTSHPSDPRLAAMRAKIDADAKQVGDAIYTVLGELIGQQALFFGASKAFHAAHGAMMTRDLARLADLGAYEHVAGAAPHYDRERGVVVADPRTL